MDYFSFVSGLGCGLSIGLSLFALRKYVGSVKETAKTIKRVNTLFIKIWCWENEALDQDEACGTVL